MYGPIRLFTRNLGSRHRQTTALRRTRVNIHRQAKSCPASRGLFIRRVLSGMKIALASEMAGFSERTGHKWLRRFREEGDAGLMDRSSRPRRLARSHEHGLVVEAIGRRRQGQAAIRIGRDLGVPRSTVGFWLRRAGTSQPSALQPKEPDNRYEHAAPGNRNPPCAQSGRGLPSAPCVQRRSFPGLLHGGASG